MKARRTIRMFPDWGHEWPLWENSTETRDYGYTMCPDDYGLSDQLTAELRQWYDDWQRCIRIEGKPPWLGSPSRLQWIDHGRRIAESLRREVVHFADVRYEP